MTVIAKAIGSIHRATSDRQGEIDEYIARVAKFDESALAALYEATSSAVYGYALSILKHRQNAEDVMQDTYLKIFDAASSYSSQGKPMAWIMTIVRNLSMAKLRERGASPLPEEDEVQIAVSGDFTEESMNRSIVNDALQKLNDDERDIVMLHSLSGLKHREIAELMDMPLSTVLSKYKRSLSKLKIIMEERA